LRLAVGRYPNYAPAHSMLAFALLVSVYVGWLPAGSERDLAEQSARRAADLDGDDPWAHLALGFLAFTDRKTDEAVRHLNMALELNPNFSAAAGFAVFALGLGGRPEEALRRVEQAFRMSPRDPFNSFFFVGVAAAHMLAGRYAEAVKWARQAVQLRPGYLGGQRILCASLALGGEIEEARSILKGLRQVQPDISVAWIKQSVPYTAEPMEHFLQGMRKAGLE
jgi:tetratricopeptide (TPR) repeat protein